jgi:hypothetical protein
MQSTMPPKGRAMRRTRDRAQANEHWRRWYRAHAATKREWQQRRRAEMRRWWNELKATKQCDACGENAPECLHFHHGDPAEKELDISNAASQGMAKRRILAEVAKCRVLCANCHLKHHWDERK